MCNRATLPAVIQDTSRCITGARFFMTCYPRSARLRSTSAKVLACAAVLLLVAVDCPAKKPQDLEDRYETINQALAPLVALLTRNGSAGNHSLNLEASVVDVTGLPEQMKGAHLRIAYEFPDKLLVQFPSPGSTATVCRNGQSVWASPAAMFIPLVERIDSPLSTQPLPPMEIEAKKAVFLPALLNVRDGGTVRSADHNYRVLDVRPITLARHDQAKDWPGRLWISPEDHRLAQLALRFSTWSVTLLIEKLELAPALPPETWNPAAEQRDQVAAVPGEKIFTLIDLALKQNR
jgi:hypothetical protein